MPTLFADLRSLSRRQGSAHLRSGRHARPSGLLPLLLLLSFFVIESILAGAAIAMPDAGPRRLEATSRAGGGVEMIIFGEQPLAVPIGVVSEVMKRDRILHRRLRELGVEIRFRTFLKGGDVNEEMRNGRVDAAFAGDMPVITAAAVQDVVVTALAKQGFGSIVTVRDPTVSDLRGRRIGFPPGSIAHYGMLAALSAANLGADDVKLVPMAVHDLPEALAAGKIDALSAFEPVPSLALKRIENSRVIFRYLSSSYLYFDNRLLQRHPEAADLVVAAMVRSFFWMRKNEGNLRMAASWSLAAQQRASRGAVPLSVDEVAAITRSDLLGIASSPVIPEKSLGRHGTVRKEFEFLKTRGFIPAAAPWEKVARSFDRRIIRKVLAHPKLYQLTNFDYVQERDGQ